MALSDRRAAKILSALLRRIGLKPRYQTKRAFSFEERWLMISSCLVEGDRNVLDVGCNLGEFTVRFAKHGFFALGLDSVPRSIQAAVKRNAGTPNSAFGVSAMSPESVRLLPAFDVTLCLSVSHYWHREYGEEQCWMMIKTLIARSRVFIIEAASIRQKYGATPPNIQDNDETSITAYYGRRLKQAAGSEFAVRYLGRAKSLGKEQFRYLFVVEKAGL